MTITEFLIARVEEDEAVAKAVDFSASSVVMAAGQAVPHIYQWRPARVLNECGSKRRIINLHKYEVGDGSDDCGFSCRNNICPTLAILADAYASHEDYDPRWTR